MTSPKKRTASSADGELLLEVGTEEIPASFLRRALAELPNIAKRHLQAARLGHGEIVGLGTPRRLLLSVKNLVAKQQDISETVMGPPVRVALDSDGHHTQAALGFARKLGVSPDAFTVVAMGKKGDYIAARREETGKPTSTLLTDILPAIIRDLPWKKSMRWHNYDESFVRPVHWIVALFAGEVVPFSMFQIKSSGQTRGHRVMAPAALSLTGSLADYQKQLAKAFVISSHEHRRALIESELVRVSSEYRTIVRRDQELLEEVSDLVEFPKAVCGEFDPAFLDLPHEVLVLAMKSHQRYFATEQKDGTLSNKFVTIAGTVVKDMKVVAKGNERVLFARLADARFFFEEDRRASLDEWAAQLDGVVYQKQLGTLLDKVERMKKARLDEHLGVDKKLFERAVTLCKVDLVSKMVGEFPELQGVMGATYAGLANEPNAVVAAIAEHYLPRSATDALPKSDLGAAVGIADRIDTLVGCFAVGLAPTGSADAFGLRRAALAVINILLSKNWHASLAQLVDAAASQLGEKVKWKEEVRSKLLEFLLTRLRGLLVDARHLPADCVDAALAGGFEDVPDALLRARAVAQLCERPDFEPLGVAFKRVANILKSANATGGRGAGDAKRRPSVVLDTLVHASEKALWQSFCEVRERVDGHVNKHEYDAALRELATLKSAVDQFFDDVMVMDKDHSLRQNRLALLGTINESFTQIADFSQLAVGT